MKHRKAWALIDGNGEIVFFDGQAEIYTESAAADIANQDQDERYSIIRCTVSWILNDAELDAELEKE
jgi:hypothetical protein